MDQTVGRSNCHLSGHRLEIYRKQRSGCTPFYCLKTYRKRTGNPSISTLGLELLNIAFEPSNDEHEVHFFRWTTEYDLEPAIYFIWSALKLRILIEITKESKI
jgi:hypothetical protein